jgi:hypothetical protein
MTFGVGNECRSGLDRSEGWIRIHWGEENIVAAELIPVQSLDTNLEIGGAEDGLAIELPLDLA